MLLKELMKDKMVDNVSYYSDSIKRKSNEFDKLELIIKINNFIININNLITKIELVNNPDATLQLSTKIYKMITQVENYFNDLLKISNTLTQMIDYNLKEMNNLTNSLKWMQKPTIPRK